MLTLSWSHAHPEALLTSYLLHLPLQLTLDVNGSPHITRSPFLCLRNSGDVGATAWATQQIWPHPRRCWQGGLKDTCGTKTGAPTTLSAGVTYTTHSSFSVWDMERGHEFPPLGPNSFSLLHLSFAPRACLMPHWPYSDSTSTTSSCQEAPLLPWCRNNYWASSPTA